MQLKFRTRYSLLLGDNYLALTRFHLHPAFIFFFWFFLVYALEPSSTQVSLVTGSLLWTPVILETCSSPQLIFRFPSFLHMHTMH